MEMVHNNNGIHPHPRPLFKRPLQTPSIYFQQLYHDYRPMTDPLCSTSNTAEQ